MAGSLAAAFFGLDDPATANDTDLANHSQLDAARGGRGDLATAERELYDIDHAELGAWLTRA